MKVSRWGKTLAVQLPVDVVKSLHLRNGSSVEVSIKRTPKRPTKKQRQKAIEALHKLQWEFPGGFAFDREEVHERGNS